MVHYLPYNPNSTVRVEEIITVRSGKGFLRHIPKQGSVFIDGFLETDSAIPQANQFSCLYAVDSLYRDANRVLNFSRTHDNQSLTVSYIAIGTVVTAEDMNELKAHIEDQSIHGFTLQTASKTTKGGIKVGDNLHMQGDTLHADAQAVEVGSGLVKVNDIIQASLGQGLHFDGQGRIEIYLGNGVVMSDVMRGFRANGDGSFSVLVDNRSLGFDSDNNNAVSVKTSQGLQTTQDGIEVKTGNGLAFDANGGIFVFLGRGLSYDDQNRVQVKVGNGLTFDNQNKIIANLGSGLAFDSEGKIKVTGLNQQLALGAGIYLDDDGNLTTNPPVTQWQYRDSGYDVIPECPLVYVDDNHFYQPIDITYNNMFNTPAAMELWLRFDLRCESPFDDSSAFRIGAFSISNQFVCHLYNYGWPSSFDVLHLNISGISSNKFLSALVAGDNHILFHMVSHPTDGYVEVTCNYNTFRFTGNVFGGNPFEGVYVYSATSKMLFSNLLISNTQIPYQD